MTTETEKDSFSCEYCEEEFDEKEQLDEHMGESHSSTSKDRGDSEDSATASTNASGSTGSITEETNQSPSAAEPSEAAGPSGSGDDVQPKTDDSNEQ